MMIWLVTYLCLAKTFSKQFLFGQQLYEIQKLSPHLIGLWIELSQQKVAWQSLDQLGIFVVFSLSYLLLVIYSISEMV